MPVLGVPCPWGARPQRPHPQNAERRRAWRRAGAAASTTELVTVLRGQPCQSATPATQQTLARGAFSRGETEALEGWGEWERDMGISDCAAALGDATPASCRGQAGDGWWGQRFALGVPGALAGARSPGPWARPSLRAALEATRLCWRWPKAGGGRGGCLLSCWGFQHSPLPAAPGQGRDPRGAGGAWGGSRCQLGSMPATKASQRAQRNEVASVQVPTVALVQKIHPELLAVATAMGWAPRRGGGHDPGAGCARTGQTPVPSVQGGGSSAERRSRALAGTKGSCPGSRCLRPPLMCRDFALGKAGRLPRSSQLDPGIQHPGACCKPPASPGAPKPLGSL